MPISAIIFDCDGTLVDSETLSAEVLRDQLAEHHIHWEHDALLRFMRGREFAVVVEELRAANPVFEVAPFIATYRARSMEVLRTRLQPIEGAVPLVQALVEDRGLPVCVASNGPRAKIETCLRATGMEAWFGDRIVSAFEANAWKPDPAIVLEAARRLNTAPAECLLVEDSAPGIEAGIAAGVQVVGFRIEAPDPAWPAAQVQLIDDLHDVLRRVAA